MNYATMEYCRDLEVALACRGKTKRQLMERFDRMLTSFLEENPDPTAAELEEAFGTPKQMAQTMLEELPQKDKAKRDLRLKVFAVLFCILVGTISGIISYFAGFE